MAPHRVAAFLSLALLTVVSVPASANPTLIQSNGARACQQTLPLGPAGAQSLPSHAGYSRFAVTNLENWSLDDNDYLYLSCGFPIARPFGQVALMDAGAGFDLVVIVTAGPARRVTPQTVTCIAESYDGDGPATRFTTTRTVTVTPAQPVRMHFSEADLPAFSAFTQVAMTCRLTERTSLGRMFLRLPRYST